jgi:AraC-like DNA-binding protein
MDILPSSEPSAQAVLEPIRMGNWSRLQPKLLWASKGEIPSWAINIQLDGIGQSTDVWYLEEGTLTLHYERETETYEGPAWVVPRHYSMRQTLSPGSRKIGIRFTLNWADDSPVFFLDRTLQFPKGKYRKFDRAAADLVSFVEKNLQGSDLFVGKRSAPITKIGGYFSCFWTWIDAYVSVLSRLEVPLDLRPTLDSRVAAAIDYLRKLPLSEPLREKDLAEHCSLSVAQLNRLFHQQIGCTPVQVRNKQKMSAACQALLFSGASIKTLAYDLGFNTSQHFAFWFRKRTGQSPRDFRRTTV